MTQQPTTDQTIPARIRAIAERTPDAPAIVAAGATTSYASLVARAGACAAALREQGVERGDLVAVRLPRSAEQIAACLGAWLAGAAYLPIDPAWPAARTEALIESAGCAAVIADALPVPSDDEAAPLASNADDLAYVIYTSGSTGTPKGVEVTHANLAALAAWHLGAFAVGAGTRTSHLAGLGFDASAWEVWPTLAAGGTLHLVDDATRLDAAALRDWLVANRIEVAFAPTALAEPMVAMEWRSDTALRVLLTGAERLKVRPRCDLPFAFVNNYGPTESTVVATSGIVSPTGEGLPSIGRPIAGTQVHLIDGEIWIGGAQVARGYRGDPALTAMRFVDHPAHGRLYRTGDLAEWTIGGELAFRGRADDQVKVRGHRIEPAEVAAVLTRLPGVGASAVTVRDGELVGYVVPLPGAELSADAVRTTLAAQLPDYMVPSRFARIEALPLTASGKVDLAALPDPAAHALGGSPAAREPATPTERRILAMIREVIGRDDVGVEDDFFLLGGHSLLGTQLVVRARDAFGVELTLFHLFEGRTAASLAGIVERLVIEKLDSLSDEDVRRLAAG